jgi:hypothetical protein
MLVLYHSRQFAMSHGSYNSNLGSEILILVGDIRSRSWPNISGTYGRPLCLQSNQVVAVPEQKIFNEMLIST